MKTKRQEELVNSFVSMLGNESKPLYLDIIMCFTELGYYPQKENSNISFKHSLHNKQIGKFGMKKGKAPSPFFALRFSACHGYSQRFVDIVNASIARYPSRAALCINAGCTHCSGAADTHVYTCTSVDGKKKANCGAYALEIPDIAADDIDEIKKLIKEEHGYLMEHEADLSAM